MKILPKEKSVRLAKGLTALEFKCRCSYPSCKATIISKELIRAYALFRELVNCRLTINSGFRCAKHNADEGGQPLSRHQVGQAIDISLKSINHIPISRIQMMAEEAGFTYIKIYKTFIHLDVR